uniref:Uncharacterized protein n=1 Tax=Arundo donax TaxID=35708 RepID=A0A0A9AZE1_ARUDO
MMELDNLKENILH